MKPWKRINKVDHRKYRERLEKESGMGLMERVWLAQKRLNEAMDFDLFRSFMSDGTSKKRRRILTLS